MTNNIPSEEDFARASVKMKKRSRGLSDVRERILERFSAVASFTSFLSWIVPNVRFVLTSFILRKRTLTKLKSQVLKLESKMLYSTN